TADPAGKSGTADHVEFVGRIYDADADILVRGDCHRGRSAAGLEQQFARERPQDHVSWKGAGAEMTCESRQGDSSPFTGRIDEVEGRGISAVLQCNTLAISDVGEIDGSAHAHAVIK